MLITISSSAYISSTLKSPAAYSISVLLSSPYFSRISTSSSLMIFILMSTFSSISFNRVIKAITSLCSSLNFSISRPVNFCKRRSRMALAWRSLKSNFWIKPSLAMSGVFEARINAITSSRLSTAIMSPSRMWARFSACLNSNSVLLTTTSCLCSIKWLIRDLRLSNSGLPLTSAILLTLNED